MPYNIIIGRDDAEKKKFGEKAAIFLGKHYVRMGQTTSLSNNILMDVAKAHVVLVAGKRGSGKSTSLAVMAEEMVSLPKEISKNLAVVIIDTMGIFWTTKFPNKRQEDLLKDWNMKAKGFDAKIFVPAGYYQDYKKRGIPADFSFSIKTSELNSSDWCNVFGLSLNGELGTLLDRTLREMKENYSIQELIKRIRADKKSDRKAKDALENRLLSADGWGVFSKEGSEIKDIVKNGQVTVLDISPYTHVSGNWGIKGLVVGIIARKLLEERIATRKVEEMASIRQTARFFVDTENEKPSNMTWLLIDEAHELLPRNGENPAKEALIQILREGRQPGISMVLATQQPGEIARDALTQADIVISHRLTAKFDLDALNTIMQTYLLEDIQKYMNELPHIKGSAIVLDDNSERIYPMGVRPRYSWHGGEAPSALIVKKDILGMIKI